MKNKIILKALVALGFLLGNTNTHGQKSDIVEAASKSKDLGTLSVGVIAADLTESLKSEGPFTVFAPDNAAFNKLPEGTLESLLLPESKSRLAEIINFHVVKGNYDLKTLKQKLMDGNGKIELTTISGKKITLFSENNLVKLLDDSGNIATITSNDLLASNGIIHTIDHVVMP